MTEHDTDPFSAGNPVEPSSKSQVKREMLAITELGKSLVALPFDRVKQLPLDEKIIDAIRSCQKITTLGEGRRRQTQYIGKLLRQADIGAIRQQLDQWENGSQAATAQLHFIERWRDRIVNSDAALTALLQEHPGLPVQQLRSLIRAARKEQQHNATLQAGQTPQRKHYRALFQCLKTHFVQEEV